jgi:hypothetical protein
MKLLLLINGSLIKIFQANLLKESDFEIQKIDEKDLAKPRHILNILKKNKYDEVYFACIENNLQRFHFFMFIYLFLSLNFKGGIIDEQGNKISFSMFKFIFVYFPKFISEVIISILVIIYYKLKIPILRWRLKVR